MFKVKSIIAALALSVSFTSFGDEAPVVSQDAAVIKNIEAQFERLSMDAKNIEPSPVAGLYQVMTDRGLFYFSEKGNFLVHGTVYNIDEGMRNETEVVLGQARRDSIEDEADSMIVYKAKNEKHVISVFTDISCGYCRKLHNELQDYLDAGITVRYLAFPRGGTAKQSYQDMVNIWCADDQQQALTDAKIARKVVESKACKDPVLEHYQLGNKLGVSGTPAIILQDGTLIPGYKPADALLQVL